MCIWVSWKNGRTRAANLMKLGVPEHEAHTHGMSSKGPWVLSSRQAVHQALSTALLEDRFAKSVRYLGEAYCQESNRLVRTRMRSWCGRGSGATRTPIPMDYALAATELGFLPSRAVSHFLSDAWLSLDRCPASRFATLMSSSRSGQCIPRPLAIRRQDLRSVAVP